ncbi:PP138 [Orf virus]|uniref:PP138 n=1 Tax=Orf virus TaxID=10258 RepID=F1AWU6_ORFV|nr:PP138 [Orf virus]
MRAPSPRSASSCTHSSAASERRNTWPHCSDVISARASSSVGGRRASTAAVARTLLRRSISETAHRPEADMCSSSAPMRTSRQQAPWLNTAARCSAVCRLLLRRFRSSPRSSTKSTMPRSQRP